MEGDPRTGPEPGPGDAGSLQVRIPSGTARSKACTGGRASAAFAASRSRSTTTTGIRAEASFEGGASRPDTKAAAKGREAKDAAVPRQSGPFRKDRRPERLDLDAKAAPGAVVPDQAELPHRRLLPCPPGFGVRGRRRQLQLLRDAPDPRPLRVAGQPVHGGSPALAHVAHLRAGEGGRDASQDRLLAERPPDCALALGPVPLQLREHRRPFPQDFRCFVFGAAAMCSIGIVAGTIAGEDVGEATKQQVMMIGAVVGAKVWKPPLAWKIVMLNGGRANVDARRITGRTPTDAAAFAKRRTGTIDALAPAPRRTAKDGTSGAVKALTAAGANVDATTDSGFTALHRAAFNGHVNVIKLFMAAGADANSKDETGRTPLDHASEADHSGVIEAPFAGGTK